MTPKPPTVYLDFWTLSPGTRSSEDCYGDIEKRIRMLSGCSRVEISRERNGKPGLRFPEGWYFNLSHSGNFACCGYAAVDIGLDVEIHKPRQFNSIADMYFHEDERDLLANSVNLQNFYTIWTRKEAWLKMHGKSIWSLKEAPNMVTMKPGIPSFVSCWNDETFSLSFVLNHPGGHRMNITPFSPCPELIPVTFP